MPLTLKTGLVSARFKVIDHLLPKNARFMASRLQRDSGIKHGKISKRKYRMGTSFEFQLGYDVYLGPMKGKENPYLQGSMQADDWQAGFDHAQADCAW